MKVGNWYKFRDGGDVHVGQYTGRQRGFECCVCGKGCNAHTFNIWYQNGKRIDYETWGYGPKHLPEILEDLGESETEILDYSLNVWGA